MSEKISKKNIREKCQKKQAKERPKKKAKRKQARKKNVRKKCAIFEKCFEKPGHEKYTVYKKKPL